MEKHRNEPSKEESFYIWIPFALEGLHDSVPGVEKEHHHDQLTEEVGHKDESVVQGVVGKCHICPKMGKENSSHKYSFNGKNIVFAEIPFVKRLQIPLGW